MNREERFALYRTELAKIADVEFSFTVFTDAGHPGRVVQLSYGGEESFDLIEATNSYNVETGELAAVPPALAGLGFASGIGPYPSRDLDVSDQGAAPAIIDAAFLALGAAEDFSVVQYHTDTGTRAWSDGAEIIPYVPLQVVSDDAETQAMLDELNALEEQERQQPQRTGPPVSNVLQHQDSSDRIRSMVYVALAVVTLIALALILSLAP